MPESDSAINEAAFRLAMRGLAATVTVISARSTGPSEPEANKAGQRAGHRAGMTATAVTSVAATPPTLLVCVNRLASMHAHLALGSRFCINVLRVGQSSISRAFSGGRQGEDRFADGDWRSDAEGLPFLADAQANLFCTVDLIVPYATHSIIVGLVDRVRHAEQITPLIYHSGDYFGTGPL